MIRSLDVDLTSDSLLVECFSASAMSTSTARKRSQSGNIGDISSSNDPNNKQTAKGSNTMEANKLQNRQSQSCTKNDIYNIFLCIGRLITILIKGFTAFVIFALLLNLAVSFLQKTVLSPSIAKIIPVKNWREFFGF